MSDDDGPLAAGDFSSWLTEVTGAIRGRHGSEVACGDCSGCCTSAQFVHIGPDEADALAHIPPELTFPAPRLPAGHVLMGYDERGHCPMLVEGRCSIYQHRPRTCRTYDCRVFAAAGLEPDGTDKVGIARRTRRWRFAYPEPADRNRHDAVRAAATFLTTHPDALPPRVAPTNTTQVAVAAVEIHDLFIHPDGAALAHADPELVQARLEHRAE